MSGLLSVVSIYNPADIASPEYAPAARFNGHEASRTMDLDQVRQLMGILWVPTYVPPGYEFLWSKAAKAHASRLRFDRSSPASSLLITESPKPAHVQVLATMYSPVTVRDGAGYVIRGGWVTGGPGRDKRSWSEKIALALMCELDHWVIGLVGHPATAWSEQELMRVADSLRLF